jgi:hypothetical protein
MNSDFKDLLSLFEKHQVRYLVAGGYAVMFHSEPRYTKDLDIVVGTASGEAERVAIAMAEFGFPMTLDQIETWKKPNQMIVLGRPPSRIDVLNELTGIDFDDAWQRRVYGDVGKLRVAFLSIEDLLTAKRAVGRPQDLIDVAALEAAKNSTTER